MTNINVIVCKFLQSESIEHKLLDHETLIVAMVSYKKPTLHALIQTLLSTFLTQKLDRSKFTDNTMY